MKKLIAAAGLLTAITFRVFSQNSAWIVPGDQKGRLAPVKFTSEMVNKGEAVYLKNCQSCHGLPAKKNFAAIVPSPGDLSEARVASQTDGELFFRITSGKAPMPEFRNILSEDERWSVISYLRSFHRGYVQSVPGKEAAAGAKQIRLNMKYDTAKKKIMVRAMESGREGNQPVKGVPLAVYVQRYFGKLQIADLKPSSDAGYSGFDWPVDLPGDKNGKVILEARISDPSGSWPGAVVRDTLEIGVPTDIPQVTETRAMWTTRDKAPVWVILTYCLAVIIVWYFIVHILLSVLNIRHIKEKEA